MSRAKKKDKLWLAGSTALVTSKKEETLMVGGDPDDNFTVLDECKTLELCSVTATTYILVRYCIR